MDVEIWSDIACPWCYIGKRRFEAALERFEHRDQVRVTWRSFELDPSAPREREGERAAILAAKYGVTLEQARQMEAHVAGIAAGEGLGFRPDIVRSGSTFDGHRLIHLAAEHGLQDAMKERLLAAHHCEGLLVSDHDTLVAQAEAVGLDPQEARAVLGSDRFADAVRADEAVAAKLGIRGVPFFVVDRRIGALGAQDPDVLLAMLRRGWEARSPLTVVGDGEACGVDGEGC